MRRRPVSLTRKRPALCQTPFFLTAFALIGLAATSRTALCQTPLAVPAAPTGKKAPRRAVTKTIVGTLGAVDPAQKTLRLQPATGDAVTILIRDNSVFTKKGKPAAGAADFAAGDRVVARVSERASAAGELWLREMRDQASQTDYERDRRGITVGAVASTTKERIEVRRPDGSVATFGVTKGTLVRKNGAPARLDAFSTGSPVAVKPRAAFGKLNAAIVADTLAEVNAAHAETLSRWRGVVQSLDADKNRLVLKREGDDAIRTIALAPTVSIKKARVQTPLTLKDVAPGTFVDLRLAKGVNQAGERTAQEIRITAPRKPRAAAGGKQ